MTRERAMIVVLIIGIGMSFVLPTPMGIIQASVCTASLVARLILFRAPKRTASMPEKLSA